jgi:hypothetical protein
MEVKSGLKQREREREREREKLECGQDGTRWISGNSDIGDDLSIRF